MKYTIFIIIFVGLIGCGLSKKDALPILGRHEYIDTDSGTDTVFHIINDFNFLDQDSVLITNRTFKDKLYVADFFFTSCPSICPLMKVQLLRIYKEFEDNPQVMLLSHTIDPEYDNVAKLNDYANRLEVSSEKWHFVTGEKAAIYDMAQTSYYTATRENSKAPGGYEHSGAFILVDPQRRIRGIYDGTKPESVDKLIVDIKTLLLELND